MWWVLVTRKKSVQGYWFPGKEHDGAAGGGFEPLFEGETWLNQPHHGGSWYYSCEIDLGFCGGVRGDCVILAEDPLFGTIVYGGSLKETDNAWQVAGADGAGRKFHYVGKEKRFHVILDRGRFADGCAAVAEKDASAVKLFLDPETSKLERTMIVKFSGKDCSFEKTIVLEARQTEVEVELK